MDRKRGASPAQRSLPVCYCKDFASLPTDDGDKLAIYRLAKKPCTCGSGVLSCKSKHHVAALNCISAVHESLKDYKQAYRSASLLVIAAPHVPEGYLRMAKALQLKDPSNKLKTKDLCLWIMTQGTTSVQTYGDRNHKLLKVWLTCPDTRHSQSRLFTNQPCHIRPLPALLERIISLASRPRFKQ